MEFSLIRIDDRLIHGQVLMGWTGTKGINTIIAIDDIVANDSFQCSLLQFATPSGVKSYILTVDKAVELINSGNLANKKVLLLAKGPETLVRLIEKGIPLNNINVGNVRPKNGQIELVSHIYAREEDIEYWKKLCMVSSVIGQILPDSPKSNINEIILKY